MGVDCSDRHVQLRMVDDDLIRGLPLGNQGTDNFIFKTQFMSGETDAGTGVRKRFPIFAVSSFGIVVIFVGNRAMVYKLCAAIANIRGPVQTVAAFFFEIRACLVAGGAGSTFHTTENNFSTDIFLFAMASMNAEVMGIVESTFMPPIRKLTGFDLFGDGSWIHA